MPVPRPLHGAGVWVGQLDLSFVRRLYPFLHLAREGHRSAKGRDPRQMLGAHKAAVVRTAIEAAALSPTLLTRTEGSLSDFDFIEQAFAKLNALLRKVVALTVAYLRSPSGATWYESWPGIATTLSQLPDTKQTWLSLQDQERP